MMAAKKAGKPQKDDEQNRRPFNTNLDKGLVLKAQIQCLNNGVNMNDVIEALLKLWLNGKVEIEFSETSK